MTENERVREVRKSENLTLEEFGKRLGVGKSAVSDVERSRNALSDQMCRSICREFGVREAWLRNGEEPMREPEPARPVDELDRILLQYGLPASLRGLFLRYAKLSEPAQKEVENMIQEWAAEITDEKNKSGE